MRRGRRPDTFVQRGLVPGRRSEVVSTSPRISMNADIGRPGHLPLIREKGPQKSHLRAFFELKIPATLCRYILSLGPSPLLILLMVGVGGREAGAQDTILYGASYYHEYMPYERLEKDVELMQKAGITVMRLGRIDMEQLGTARGGFPVRVDGPDHKPARQGGDQGHLWAPRRIRCRPGCTGNIPRSS